MLRYLAPQPAHMVAATLAIFVGGNAVAGCGGKQAEGLPATLNNVPVLSPRPNHAETRTFYDKNPNKDEHLVALSDPHLSGFLQSMAPLHDPDNQEALLLDQSTPSGGINIVLAEFNPDDKKIVAASTLGVLGLKKEFNSFKLIIFNNTAYTIVLKPMKKGEPSSWGVKVDIKPTDP